MKRIVFCVVYMGYLSADMIDNLAQALNTIASTSQQQVHDHGLLGPWLQKEKPNTLIKVDETYAEKHDNKIYQIKVLTQSKAECGLHAFRNALYLMDILSSPRKKFDEIYTNMESEQQYESFVNAVGCKRDAGSNFIVIYDITNKIKDKKINCVGSCLPVDSYIYVDDIVSFRYYKDRFDNINVLGQFSGQTEFFNKVKVEIKKIEPNLKDQESVALDVSSLCCWNNQHPFFIKRLVEPIRIINHTLLLNRFVI